jgi:glutamate formiminotransferase/formiminotetrahydrofolate cyclodeaminase
VKINTGSLDDKTFVEQVLARGNEIQEKAIALETEIRAMVDKKI